MEGPLTEATEAISTLFDARRCESVVHSTGMTSSSRPPAIQGVTESFATVAGRRMRYLTVGSGPPLVLLHGLLGYSFSWRFNFAELGKVATLYAPDALGCGFSERDAGLDCTIV